MGMQLDEYRFRYYSKGWFIIGSARQLDATKTNHAESDSCVLMICPNYKFGRQKELEHGEAEVQLTKAPLVGCSTALALTPNSKEER